MIHEMRGMPVETPEPIMAKSVGVGGGEDDGGGDMGVVEMDGGVVLIVKVGAGRKARLDVGGVEEWWRLPVVNEVETGIDRWIEILGGTAIVRKEEEDEDNKFAGAYPFDKELLDWKNIIVYTTV